MSEVPFGMSEGGFNMSEVPLRTSDIAFSMFEGGFTPSDLRGGPLDTPSRSGAGDPG